jgi:hypothetical protein
MHNITLSFSSMYQWMTGWWLSHRSEKYEFVSWDDDIPNIRKNNPSVPNHQPGMDFVVVLHVASC